LSSPNRRPRMPYLPPSPVPCLSTPIPTPPRAPQTCPPRRTRPCP
jgi:hypothetical protein